jgi:outer membrane protein assembly factor BamD
LINDVLAAKEIYIGRYYFDKKKWISAINRFRTITDDYDSTIYVEEALHRLVEIYYIIGLEDESKKYANLLGYNYMSSKWYEKSYSIFDKSYEENKKNIAKNKKFTSSLLKKFKSLFN